MVNILDLPNAIHYGIVDSARLGESGSPNGLELDAFWPNI